MNTQRHHTQRLFLFDLTHHDFVEGEVETIPTAVTRKLAVRQYVFLMFLIALPMIITITVLIALAGYRIELLLLTELSVALVACAYFVLRRYLKDRILRHQGQIVYGEVLRQEILPGYSGIGPSVITRIFYRFVTPDNDRIIESIDFGYVANRLPDGRKYPLAGTPIAVLYANDKNHKLL